MLKIIYVLFSSLYILVLITVCYLWLQKNLEDKISGTFRNRNLLLEFLFLTTLLLWEWLRNQRAVSFG